MLQLAQGYQIFHYSLFIISGAAMVSTGVVKWDKRVEDRTLFKRRTFLKLNDNDNFELAAA